MQNVIGVLLVVLVAAQAAEAGSALPEGVVVDTSCTPFVDQHSPGHRYITTWTVSDDYDIASATVTPGDGEDASVLKFVSRLEVFHYASPDSQIPHRVSSGDFVLEDEALTTSTRAVAHLVHSSSHGEYFKAYVYSHDGNRLIACATITV